MKPNKDEKRYQVPKERRLIAFVIDYVPGYAFLIFMVLFFVYAKNKGRAEEEGLWAGQAGEGGGYLGILNANPALIESISNESGTLTGDFSTRSLAGSTASGRDGTIVRAESVWETPKGQYQKVGSVYLTPDGDIVTRAGSAFVERDDIRVKAGSAYVGRDGIATLAGGVVIKPGWSSR